MNKEEKKTLEDYVNKCFQNSSDYSSILSSICRQIAFAEGALYWFLYSEFNLSTNYIMAGYLFLLFYFFSDMAQYFLGYLVYKIKAKQNQIYLKNELKTEYLYEISEDDLYWVYKAMNLKLLFIVVSSLTLIIIFSVILICNLK